MVKLALMRAGALLSCVALLPSCGGGGGAGGGGSGNDTYLNVSPTNVTLEAAPGDATPVQAITIHITHPVSDLYLSGRGSSFGIEDIEATQTGTSSMRLDVQYRPPGSLQDGRYED